MAHPDEHDLVLLALGEDDLDDATREHLRGCAVCTSALEQLRRVVELGHEIGEERTAAEPAPAALWEGIAAQLDLPGPEEHDVAAAPAAVGTARPGPVGSTVTSLRPRRRRTLLLAAAAAAVLLVGGVGAGVLIGRSSVQQVARTDSASAQLAPVGTAGTGEMAGEAVVTKAASGSTLTVTTEHLPLQNGFYQVWLYDKGSGNMVPIGTLDGSGRGTFTLTPSIDLRSYNVVDISVQQLNGDPAHGTSMLQGTLALR